MRERRRSKRIQTDGDVVAQVQSAVAARVIDISPFGAQVEVRTPLRPGSECTVAIPVADGELRFRSVVRRCRVAGVAGEAPPTDGELPVVYRAGLEFASCSEEEARLIREAYGSGQRRTSSQSRSGPIRIKVDTGELERRLGDD